MRPVEPFNARQPMAQMASAWRFLCGQDRAFEYLGRRIELLQFAEYSFLMSLTSQDGQRCGGVGVLMDHEDAMAVAMHMFDRDRTDIREADLRDACSEVCNLLADCLVTHFDDGTLPKAGLPRSASPVEYDAVAASSKARAIFRGEAGSHRVFVVLYDSPCNRPEQYHER